MKRRTRLSLAVVASGLLLGGVDPSSAASIGVSFVGRNADPADLLAPADSAGVVPQPNWTNIRDDAATFDGTVSALVDNAGAFTAVQLVYTASDSWSSDGPTVTPDDKLMKGVIKANPNPDTAPADGSDKMTFKINGLAAGTYDVIVYATVNGTGAKMALNAGTTTYYFEEQASFDGAFVPATSTDPNNYELGPNYARFPALPAAADGSITINATKLIENPQINDGIGVAGIQIISAAGFPANAVPVAITTQPASQTVGDGDTVSFTVAFTGPGKIQWQKDGADIAGATSATYTHTATLAENGAKYTAKISNNVNSLTSAEATLTVTASAAVLTQGFARVERWENIGSGTDVQSLIDVISAATLPTTSFFVGAMDVPQTSPDIGNFGCRVSAWLKPDVTGDYYFFTRSDDASAVYLNSTAAASGTNALPDVTTDTVICEETDCCDPFYEPDSGDASTTATPIHLEAGKLYGLVALYKEGGGGDFLQVAWRISTDTTAAATLLPIPGKNLWIMSSPSGKTATITKQPVSVTALQGTKATFTIEVTTAPTAGNYSVQWLKNGTAIPGATSATYTTPTLALADSGTKYKAEVLTLIGPMTSDEATLTVVVDNVPPVAKSASALKNKAGTFDVGVQFDEPLDKVSAEAAANYTIAGGTISTAAYLASSPGVMLTVSGLAAGSSYTVNVKNVKDVNGNAMAATDLPFTVSAMAWDVVGGDELGLGVPGGNAVLAVSTNGWDVYSDSSGEWGTYDEATFVWEKITGDFDKKLRVEYQDNASQWARAGLIMRDVPNFGVDRATQEGGAAGRYQKIHVNPVGPTRTGPGTGGNQTWELNRRLNAGDATTAVGAVNNISPVLYPNGWVRLQRLGGMFNYFRSDDGVAWVFLGQTVWPSDIATDPMLDTVYVGPEYAPENGNITTESERGRWVAKFRDYSDSFAAVPAITRNYSIGMNFAADHVGGTTAEITSSLASTANAGVAKQKFWNNLNGANGTQAALVADMAGVSTPTTVTVTWASSGTWSNMGDGETNNMFKGDDFTLMHAYLDTGASTNTLVTISGLPADLTSGSYDVYVYALGGVNGKGGGYRILDPTSGAVIKDYIYARAQGYPSTFTPVAETSTSTNNYGAGDYIVFRGLTAASIKIEASTIDAIGQLGTVRGIGQNPRAPLNAVQLVAPGTGGGGNKPQLALTRTGTTTTITYTGTLQSADTVNGTYTDVAGATSPFTVPTTGTAKFYRSKL